jgi:hypothetical protein
VAHAETIGTMERAILRRHTEACWNVDLIQYKVLSREVIEPDFLF